MRKSKKNELERQKLKAARPPARSRLHFDLSAAVKYQERSIKEFKLPEGVK